MKTAKSKNHKLKISRNDELTAKLGLGEKTEDLYASYAIDPTIQATLTLKRFESGSEGLTFNGLIAILGKQVHEIKAGNLDRPEAILIAQAHTLDMIFNHLARRAAINMGEYIDAAEKYMKLALRAQSQCRATLETLAEIKNPKHVAFFKQANIAHGHQQVNNQAEMNARAEKIKSTQNELLEAKHGERLDERATSTASRVDSSVETLGAVNRAKDEKR